MSLDIVERERSRQLKELIDVSKPLERTMAFIDGGYIRHLCQDLFGNQKINYQKLFWKIRESFSICLVGQFQIDLVRVYYYDAIVDKKHQQYDIQKIYFDQVSKAPLFKIRLGKLVESSKEKPRQKGVDILMATDSLTKAFRNQYDTAIFMIGDSDFIPLIEAINDAGKKTICIYGPQNTSTDLIDTFDMSILIGKSEIQDMMIK